VCSAVTEEDRAYVRQALQLAERGLGQTYPNPAVGCVIVKNGKVGHDESTQKCVKSVSCAVC
jgi:pyrimidine deaminase RibD-like protein